MNKIFIVFLVTLNTSLFCAQQKAAAEALVYVEVNNHVMNQDGPTPRTIATARATAAQDIRYVQVSSARMFSTSTYYLLTPFFKNSGLPRPFYNATPVKNVNNALSKLLEDATAAAKTESRKHPKTKTFWSYHSDKSLKLVNQISLDIKAEAEIKKEAEQLKPKQKSTIKNLLKRYEEETDDEKGSSSSDGANADADEEGDQDGDADTENRMDADA